MRLVTQTEDLSRYFSGEECVRILAEAGFDAIDWSFFEMVEGKGPFCQDSWQSDAMRIRETAQECGIGFSQAHAPFPSLRGEEPFDSQVFAWICRAMQAAALMGVKNIVVHPVQHLPYAKNRERLFEMNIQFYRRLIPYCEEYGIRACAENMWQYDERRHVIIDSVCSQPEEFCALLDAVGSPWIVGCLDIGHCALVGADPAEFIRALGSRRLQALHVHDVDYIHDCHTLPFMEKLDWDPVAAALADSGYAGDFTFEADNFLLRFPKQLKPAASALMAKTGRYLISRIEANRK